MEWDCWVFVCVRVMLGTRRLVFSRRHHLHKLIVINLKTSAHGVSVCCFVAREGQALLPPLLPHHTAPHRATPRHTSPSLFVSSILIMSSMSWSVGRSSSFRSKFLLKHTKSRVTLALRWRLRWHHKHTPLCPAHTPDLCWCNFAIPILVKCLEGYFEQLWISVDLLLLLLLLVVVVVGREGTQMCVYVYVHGLLAGNNKKPLASCFLKRGTREQKKKKQTGNGYSSRPSRLMRAAATGLENQFVPS